jgi:hypothetical protein
MMFERHSLKVDGYSAIAPKRVTKTVAKAKKSKWEWQMYPLKVLFKGAGQ